MVGLICPHAGYMYSGPIAAHSYYRLASDGKPNTIILLGPNHTNYGSGIALDSSDFWRTPLGDVEIDHKLVNQIICNSSFIDIDNSSHKYEHSIEVQLPFLQYLYGSTSFKIVPISFMMQDLALSQEVGKVIATLIEKKNLLVIASSDMSHYETQKTAQRNDRLAIKSIESMDISKFYSTIVNEKISLCGYGPIATLITIAKIVQTKPPKLLCYKTSGDITGDYSSTVGYASLCFEY